MSSPSPAEDEVPVARTVLDPVCGMSVDPSTATNTALYEGETYYFCSPGCRSKFEANPSRYVSAAPAPAQAHEHPSHDHAGHDHNAQDHSAHRIVARTATTDLPTAVKPTAEATEWTCPMHPEIRRPGPGACPICGMAL